MADNQKKRRRTLLTLLPLLLFARIAQARIAVECAIHLSPCHVDTRLEMAGIKEPQEMRDFLAQLQSAARDGNHTALAYLVRYPFTLYAEGQTQAHYANAGALLADFETLFTPHVLAAIAAARYETLFINSHGAMIGDGEIWIDGWTGHILIKAINP